MQQTYTRGSPVPRSKVGSVRNRWLALAICAVPLIAAEKSRDWQTGLVLESRQEQTTRAWGSILNQKTALGERDVHTIASASKIYLVTGDTRRGRQLPVGANVRFAVEGKSMFISLAGKEFRLFVLEERIAPRDPEPSHPTDAPATDASEPLDNDAVVKMVVGGLKEDTVVRVIEARPGKYTLTPDALLALKAAGLPQSVIGAMSAKMSAQR
jgi:hypothetical protein